MDDGRAGRRDRHVARCLRGGQAAVLLQVLPARVHQADRRRLLSLGGTGGAGGGTGHPHAGHHLHVR